MNRQPKTSSNEIRYIPVNEKLRYVEQLLRLIIAGDYEESETDHSGGEN